MVGKKDRPVYGRLIINIAFLAALPFYDIYITPLEITQAATENPSPSRTANSSSNKTSSEPEGPATKDKAETEVAAFILTGKKVLDKLEIPDLEIINGPEGLRYLPLFRLLKAMQISWREEDRKIIFQAEGSPSVSIIKDNNLLEIEETTVQLNAIIALSDIALSQEIFLPPQIISRLLSIDLEWNEEKFAYIARTSIPLTIWKRAAWRSPLSMEIKRMAESLPEAHGPANPKDRAFSIDFLELQGSARAKVIDPYENENISTGSLRQTAWGELASGNYMVSVSESEFIYDGSTFEKSNDAPFRLEWAEWLRRSRNKELLVGDSIFGLNDLNYRTVNFSGIRINGLLGNFEDASVKSARFGLNEAFGEPKSFEGYAPVGSRVELSVNNRVIDSYEVFQSLPSQPGIGIYRFERAVNLAPGTLNNIRITITEPNGIVTIREENVLGSGRLLPKGGASYVGGIGTYRDKYEQTLSGTFAGGRLLYGVNDRLTLGTTIGLQDSFFDSLSDQSGSNEERPYPSKSLNIGAQAIWRPVDWSILSGEVSFFEGEAENPGGNYSDPALKFSIQAFPLEKINLLGTYFRYEPKYFDGVNKDLNDRQGYSLALNYEPIPWLYGSLALAHISDNVEDNLDETRSVDIHHLSASANILQSTSLQISYDSVIPSWDEEPKKIYAAEVASRIIPSIYIRATYSAGDENLQLEGESDFIEGINLPGFNLYSTRYNSLLISRSFEALGDIALTYWESGEIERLYLSHTGRYRNFVPLDIRTEIGYELGKNSIFFTNRMEIPLTLSKRFQLGIFSQLEKEQWNIELYLNFTGLFNLLSDKPKNISRRMDPEGPIIYGRTFLDMNANTIKDDGEPGLPGIDIIFGSSRVTSDSTGSFAANIYGENSVQVLVDPKSIPALLECTHGRQMVYVRDRKVTEINFGFTPVHSASGVIQKFLPSGTGEPLSGVKIYLKTITGDKEISNSVTANDGSYYLENIRPGRYLVVPDPTTIPAAYIIHPAQLDIEIIPSEEAQEINLPPFEAIKKDVK